MEKRQRQILHQRSEAHRRRKAGNLQAPDRIEPHGRELNEGGEAFGNNGEEVPSAPRGHGLELYTTHYEGNEEASSDDNATVSPDGEGDKIHLKMREAQEEGEGRPVDAPRCSTKSLGHVAHAKAAKGNTFHIGGGTASHESMLHVRDDAANDNGFMAGGPRVLPVQPPRKSEPDPAQPLPVPAANSSLKSVSADGARQEAKNRRPSQI